MRRSAAIAGVVGAVLAGGAGIAGTNPFAADDGPTARQLLNQAQIDRIVESPNAGAVALPAEQPPHLDFLQTIRTLPDASEVHFQEDDVFVVVCGGNPTDSACDAETATVFRNEDVGGVPVRVAWIVSQDSSDKAAVQVSAQQEREIEEFWKDVDIQVGVAPWLHTFS